MMYLAISLLILIISYGLFKKASGNMSLSKLNMISYIFYISIFLQSFVGSLLILFEVDNDPIIMMFVRAVSYNIRLYGWLAVLYTMIMMPCGMLLANKLFKVKSSQKLFDQYVSKSVVNLTSSRDSHIRIPLYALTVVSLATVVYTYMNLKHIPWLGVFSGFDAMQLASLREEVSSDFSGNALVRQIFGNMMTPILTYIVYSYWKMTKSKKDRNWFYVLFIATFLMLTHSLAKAPFIMFIFGFLFLSTLIRGEIKTRTLLLISAICFSMLVLIYFFIMGLTTASQLFIKPGSGLVWRLIITQIVGLYGSFTIFPDIHPHIDLISTSSMLSSFFGVESSESSARIVMRFITPDGVEQGMAGFANSLFIAEAWAHYGIAGVIISPLYVGFIIQTFYVSLLRIKKSPIYLGLYAFMACKSGVTISLWYFVLNPELMILLMIIVGTIYSAYTSYAIKRMASKS